MRVEVVGEAATPPAWRREVLVLQDAAWPADAPSTGLTHDPALAPVSVLLLDDDTVLAALDVLNKDLEHAGRTWTASGLSTVVVAPAARGRGVGLELVRAAARVTARTDLTLFTCDRPLAAFYGRAGYEVLPGTVLVGGTPDDPLRSDAPGFDKLTLAAFHSPTARAARAAFTGVDVLLHPGAIDRLW